MPDLAEITPEGTLRFNFHPGQIRAWESSARFVCVLAGTQGGKTSFGPPWLWREIQRRGPGDYMVVTPTYPLLTKKALPEFLRLFHRQLQLGGAGEPGVGYNTQQKVFTFSPDGQRRTHGAASDTPTQVFFGHAQDPDSLESATARAVWMDEAGQKKFRLGSWEALQRRLSIHEGRALITTTPYDLGWLKQKLWDPWQAADGRHPTIDVVRFDSTENPAFPRAEFARARDTLPRWKFDLFYRAIFTRPAGLIYDCFDPVRHRLPRCRLPDTWQRYLGLDFGGANTAAVFFAEEPGTRKLYAYREYRAGGRTAAEHAAALRAGEPMTPVCVGGSHSEGQWRAEFRAAGLPVQEPAVKEVEVGIDRVYGAIKRGELYVFEDLTGLLDELASYSRETDERGEPTEKIEAKETYHHLDAVRYVVGWVKRGSAAFEISLPRRANVLAGAPAGVFDERPEGGF